VIIADTSILSTFARIQRLDLLFAVAETQSLHLPPAVQKEIKLGLPTTNALKIFASPTMFYLLI